MVDTKLTIAKNILYYRKLSKLSQKELAEKIGVKHNTISSWEKGTNGIDIDSLFKISKILNVRIDTLFGVDNDLYRFQDMEHLKKYSTLDEHGKETVDAVLDKELKRIKNIKPKMYPIQGYYEPVSAGNGNPLDYSTSCIFYIDEEPPAGTNFMLKVSGDSMTPTYNDGDYIFVNIKEQPQLGQVGLFIHNGSVYIKERGKSSLISFNQKYAPIIGNETTMCIGKVIGTYRGNVNNKEGRILC